MGCYVCGCVLCSMDMTDNGVDLYVLIEKRGKEQTGKVNINQVIICRDIVK